MTFKQLEKSDIYEGSKVAVQDNGEWVFGIITDTSLDKKVFEVEFNDGEMYGEYTIDDIVEFGLMAVVEASLFISEIGTDGNIYWIIVNDQKILIDRMQYFRLMLLSEDTQELKLEDAANFNMQMATGIPAF